jgi:hypothetical protein
MKATRVYIEDLLLKAVQFWCSFGILGSVLDSHGGVIASSRCGFRRVRGFAR